MEPLVSILIPAYNAQEWIADALRSAVAQTWQRKEIIVVDDGSSDQTPTIVRQFTSAGVHLLLQNNQGSQAARNTAFFLSQGDYIQWLDADDLLLPDKIERQLAALRDADGGRILPCSPWAYFYYRTRGVRFVNSALWQDLTPVEWLLRKMGENLYMPNSTWLVSRELANAVGRWHMCLHCDEDGEYFARVLMASEGTRFVPETGVFYRVSGSNRVSNIGNSDKKKDSLFLSMKLHIQYLRSLEDSERVRKVCLTYLQNSYGTFYPERPDIVAELEALAAQLQGHLEVPRLRRKYAWMRPLLGWKAAKWAQQSLPDLKSSCIKRWDKAMYRLEFAKHSRASHQHSERQPRKSFYW